MNLGSRIRELRHKLGLKQEDLASYCDVTISEISKIETGKIKNPGSVTVARIADRLESKIEYLLYG